MGSHRIPYTAFYYIDIAEKTPHIFIPILYFMFALLNFEPFVVRINYFLNFKHYFKFYATAFRFKVIHEI